MPSANWTEVPFPDIESAWKWCDKQGLKPGEIQESEGVVFFKTANDYVYASRGDVVKERYMPPPGYEYEKRYEAGPWKRSKAFETLEDVVEHYTLQGLDAKLTSTVYVSFKQDVYEYRLLGTLVQGRVLYIPAWRRR